MRTKIALSFIATIVVSLFSWQAKGQGISPFSPSCGNNVSAQRYSCSQPTPPAPPYGQPPCAPPVCDQPPPEGPPRLGEPENPELPPIAPGAYAAPPRSGTTVGPQRGGELGGLRIRFPEFSIGLPRLEWTSSSHFVRDSHMRLDQATAPFVPNPHYETAVLQRELQLRQLQLLEEERARRERSERAEEEADVKAKELDRLRQNERELKEQLGRMQKQLDILSSRLVPRQECPPQPKPMPIEQLPCPMPQQVLPTPPHASYQSTASEMRLADNYQSAAAVHCSWATDALPKERYNKFDQSIPSAVSQSESPRTLAPRVKNPMTHAPETPIRLPPVNE